MRLKKLEIIGFKSFADKVKLEFDPGITAVVGPNGCGKSNIADAFRWVMGASTKSMRGTKTSDVIFAGTTQRKPLNFAEVTLTLCDIEGQLPIDYDEIAITRRLHRNGESEYFINRHPVRLKDVQGLLLDTGIGKDAYSIFEQGEIDRVINLPPLERRYIFEEAAGILRFLQRKREALRKLEQTDLNVSRVKDIHQEVERQIIVLQEQAEKARQYKEDKQVLEVLEKSLLVSKWDLLHQRWKDADRKAQEQQNQINGTNGQIESLQTELLEAKQTLSAAEKSLRSLGEEVFKVRSTREIKSKEKQTHKERLKEISVKETRWQDELKNLKERMIGRQGERKAIQKLQQELEHKFAEADRSVAACREKVKGLEHDLSVQRSQQQTKHKECLTLVHIENQSESEIRQASVRLDGVIERRGRLESRQKLLTQQISDLTSQVDNKSKDQKEASRAIEEQKKLFISMEKELEVITQEMEVTQTDIDRLYQEMSEAKARCKALQCLKDDMEGFSAGSKRLLQENEKSTSVLFGKLKGLYEYFTPQKGGEAALAAVMRSYSQTLAVETLSDFELVTAYIKEHKLKDISLFCLESIRKQKPKADPTPDELVELTSKIIDNELSSHFLTDSFIDKSDRSLQEIIDVHPGVSVWAGDAVFVDSKSVVFYASQGENNIFLRKAELKALEKKLVDNGREKERLDAISQAIVQRRSQIQKDRSELDKTIRRAEMHLVELNVSLQKAGVDLERARNEEKQQDSEWQGVMKSIAELSSSLESLKQQHALAKGNASTIQKEVDGLNVKLEASAAVLKEQSLDLREKEKMLQRVSDEVHKQIHALDVLEIKDTEAEQQVKRVEEEIEQGRALKTQIEGKEIEVNKLLGDVEISLTEALASNTAAEQQVTECVKVVEQLDHKIGETRRLLKKYEQDRQHTSLQSAQLESQCQSIENELTERHQLSIEAAKGLCGVVDKPVDQIDRQIRSMRQKIEQAGDINMMSIEECEKHKTRYHFLNQQLDDLNVSKQELVEIITQLDGDSRKIFQETFEQISLNFKKNFQILFNGGEADLQFTESADILEAGIEIIAKPPGKQLRSISLLSGGEKCLTAMALLFAIFEVRPAPFCILDEIDAPLDDTNVERFVNIVQQFVSRCQFILITHNKRSMAIADIIFGVSMEEKGVSKLLSMDFSKHGAPELTSV